MATVENSFRSLSRLAAECQRQVEKLHHVDSITVQKEVAELIRSSVRCLATDIEVVKQLAEEQDTESSKIKILNRLAEYDNQLKQLQVSSRQAILLSKKRVNDEEKRNREELFGIGSKRMNGKSFTEQYELKQKGLQKGRHDEAVLRASSDVTEALKRTSTLMQQELGKSTFSASMLAESSRTLASTHTEYQNLGSLIHISKNVITQLEASDWFDRLLLLFGLLMFSSVVLYIIKKRTWDVGISWVAWLSQTKRSKEKLAAAITTVIAQPATITKSIVDSMLATASPAIILAKDEL
ncbi:Sec20-domain-containing protein [Parasitella parasitica]|nr:Sec20-domain-containing protein [Parasitella parasitica]